MGSYVTCEDSEVQAIKSGQGVIGVSRRADPCWTVIDSPFPAFRIKRWYEDTYEDTCRLD